MVSVPKDGTRRDGGNRTYSYLRFDRLFRAGYSPNLLIVILGPGSPALQSRLALAPGPGAKDHQVSNFLQVRNAVCLRSTVKSTAPPNSRSIRATSPVTH